MADIQLLDKAVVEQIAAGEVIDRPASIIKELLENAIDAGATRIDIAVDGGGLTSLRITDNGAGIPENQLALAVTRHATSKIRVAEDLYAIGTMGFRGEALASVAAGSRLTITSNCDGKGVGCRLKVQGGILGELEPSQHLKGTTVLAQDLFYNLPARKKFLGSEQAEKMAISKVVEHVFFAFPAIHFTCSFDGKKRYDIPAVDSPLTRIAQVAGHDLATKLIHCRVESPDMCADIYVTEPEQASSRPRYQNLYVNLRKIESDSVLYAVREAVARFITSQLKPSWFCFLDIDPSKIDVNVHPTKQKIKFDDEKQLFSFVFRGVQAGINDFKERSRQSVSPLPSVDTIAEEGFVVYEPSSSPAPVSPLKEKPRGQLITGIWGRSGEVNAVEISENQHARRSDASQTAMTFLAVPDDAIGKSKHGLLGGGALWDSVACYQVHRQYIIAPVKEGFLMIDQHAAHERILYEKVLRDIEVGGVDAQRLLFPVTIELKPMEKDALMEMRPLFDMTGFDIQDFGGNTIAVSAVPATGFVKATQIRDAIEEMLHQYMKEDDRMLLASLHRRFAASYACGAAIKFGHEMPQEEMNSLLHQLFASENPHICPHGRPTLIKLTLDELSKRFLR